MFVQDKFPLYTFHFLTIWLYNTRDEVERNEVKSTPETKSNGTKLNQPHIILM